MKKRSIYMLFTGLLTFLAILQACRKDKDVPVEQLSISSYYPNSGKAGTLITVLGTGLRTDGKVLFGDVQAEVVKQNDTSLVVRAPENGQSGKMSFATTDKTIDIGNYTYQALSVRAFSPGNGPAGMHIRISGEGFSSLKAPAEVMINGVKATVVSASDTLIVAEIPENAGSGPVIVLVDGSSSTGANFRYQAISSINPLTGGAGTRVTIKGAGFDAAVAGNIVDFNGKPAQVVAATAEQLVAIAPDGVATGPLAVTINGQKTSGPTFTIVPKPQIGTVTPLSGPAGTEMSISGLYFSTKPEENIVRINGTAVAIKTAAGNKLTLTIPGGTGSGKVQVIVNDQSVDGPDFREQNLGILSMVPANGLAGTKVTINGIGFSTVAAENIVTFNGVNAVVESATETALVVVAPPQLSSGPLKVKLAALEATASTDFLRAGITTLIGGPTQNLISPSMNRMVVDSKGNLYVSNLNTANIYKIEPDGTMVLYAGSPTGAFGRKDGPVADALFSSIQGMVMDPQDNLFVSEAGNGNSVRKITPAGQVSTYKTGLSGAVQVVLDKNNDVYVSQTYQGMIKIHADGSTERKYTLTVADACRPAIDAAGNIYYSSDDYASAIGRITPTGPYSNQWIGSSSLGFQDGTRQTATFNFSIGGLLLDNDGNLIILDKFNYAIRHYNFSKDEVSTLAKMANGYADGSFGNAKIGANIPDIAIDRDGNIYLLDINNKAIRKVFLR